MKPTYKMKRTPLKRKPKRRQNETPRTIKAVKSIGKCQECPNTERLEIHHKLPKSMGGTSRVYGVSDLKLLCHSCHSAKHNIKEVKSEPQFRWLPDVDATEHRE